VQREISGMVRRGDKLDVGRMDLFCTGVGDGNFYNFCAWSDTGSVLVMRGAAIFSCGGARRGRCVQV